MCYETYRPCFSHELYPGAGEPGAGDQRSDLRLPESGSRLHLPLYARRSHRRTRLYPGGPGKGRGGPGSGTGGSCPQGCDGPPGGERPSGPGGAGSSLVWPPGGKTDHHRRYRYQGQDHHHLHDPGHPGEGGETHRPYRHHRGHHRRQAHPCRQHHPGVLPGAEVLCGDGRGRHPVRGDGGVQPGHEAGPGGWIYL